MTEVRESAIRLALANASLSTEALERHPATAELGLERADRNRDGTITGREIGVLTAALDRLDGVRDRRIRMRTASSTSREALHAVATMAGAEALAAETARGPRGAQTVLFVGVTSGSVREARALREHTAVRLIREVGAGEPERVASNSGVMMGLGTPTQRQAFIASLRLPSDVAPNVASVLEGVQARGRGEIAALAQEWAAAYRGGQVAARLVFSGHGDGQAVFEAHGDAFTRRDILALARAMPAAALRIRHIHVAACQHGYESRTAPYFEAFPALQSVFGYAGFAPSGATANAHQERWERASRVDGDGLIVERRIAQGTRRAVAVSVHRRREGWDGPPVEPLGDLDARVRSGANTFDHWFAGESTDADFGAEHYQTLQALTAHHDFREQSDGYRAHFERRREQSLRLRFFSSHVAPSFERAYATRLDRGYRALGLRRPDFGQLNRRSAVRAVRTFEAAMSRQARPADAVDAGRLLREGLLDLDPRWIPVRWL